ncbi:MAG: ATP-binding protein [Proteobacteria bacterium]|nr:ATP-binding protein [Pseudomonadota bacterium]
MNFLAKSHSGKILIIDDTQENIALLVKFSQSSIKINNIGGTGLGLTISKEIIDAHHGKIWLENHPDGGVLSCFIIPNQQNE